MPGFNVRAALFVVASLMSGCASRSGPPPEPPSAAPAPAIVEALPDAEMRLDFAHFPVIFDARHAYLSLYDLTDGERLVMRLHATSVELKRRGNRPYYEFRDNIGPCLKMIPFIDTHAGGGYMPQWSGREVLGLAEDSALFQNRGPESVPILAGSRRQVLGKFAEILAYANQLNDASIDYSFRGNSNPNSNSALFAVLGAAGMASETERAAQGWWFPGSETAIAFQPVSASADAFAAELDALQLDIQQAERSEPCASL